MTSWQFQSGTWEHCGSIPLDDRGFRYGMSVFETVAVAGGHPLFLKDHLERLGRAARERGWSEVVMPSSLPEIPQEARSCSLQWHGHPAHAILSQHGQDARATGVVRLYLTAGPGGIGDPLSGSLFALFEPCEVGTSFPPLRVVSSAAPYLPGPGGWKTGNYWQNVEALAFARSTGVDDALLFNPAGALVSASMGNVFVEIEGAWKTPALETGARDGVVREWVLQNLPVEEALLDARAVADSTACFVTNSRIGIRPVGELEGRTLRTDVDALQSLYREHVL
jgi:branched-subunit amino acid aminotransferase/4-amino-4-deoxychorismate lyase